MIESSSAAFDRDFWGTENQKYSTPHFRLEKCANLVNRLAGSRNCDLLDVGCGPATLMRFVRPNINYYGIDIAIPAAHPNLMELDLASNPIRFEDRTFDLIVAQGFFEYLGGHQDEKLDEIAGLLRPDGRFVASYVNFAHRRPSTYIYNNIQAMADFRASLERHFVVERYFPTSHNWRHDEPKRPWLKRANMHLNVKVPYVSPMLAVEYFFVCARRNSATN